MLAAGRRQRPTLRHCGNSVTGRQGSQFFYPHTEFRNADQQAADPLFIHGCKSHFQLGFVSGR